MPCTPGSVWWAVLALLRICGAGLGQWGSGPSLVLLCLAPALCGAASSCCSIAFLFYLQNKPNISIKIHCMSKLSEKLGFFKCYKIPWLIIWFCSLNIISFGFSSLLSSPLVSQAEYYPFESHQVYVLISIRRVMSSFPLLLPALVTGICLKLRTVTSCSTNFSIIPSPLRGLLLKLTNQQTQLSYLLCPFLYYGRD